MLALSTVVCLRFWRGYPGILVGLLLPHAMNQQPWNPLHLVYIMLLRRVRTRMTDRRGILGCPVWLVYYGSHARRDQREGGTYTLLHSPKGGGFK